MTYHRNSLSIKISTIGVAKILDWVGGKTQITCNDSVRNFQKVGFLWDRDTVEWKVGSRDPSVAHNHDFAIGEEHQPTVIKVSQNV